MICREQDGAIVMVKQHDHGKLAGELAIGFKEQHVPTEGRREEVLWAVAQHDRGWIDLDETLSGMMRSKHPTPLLIFL